MKKLVLILSLIPALVFSQDSVELKTIQYLNDYRASKGLSKLVIDKGLCKAAEHQLAYEIQVDSVTHYQYQDLPNFQEIVNCEDRIKHFSGLEDPFGRDGRCAQPPTDWALPAPDHHHAHVRSRCASVQRP